jgi:dihydrofolate reductase
MTEIIVIVAVAQNNIIGRAGDIPWRIKEDFQHFKEKTMGHPCIMGDKTYLSLPENARPLPGRENIVLTFDKNFRPEGTTVLHDFDEAIDYVKNKGEKQAFITGGATIYKLGLNVADTFELTRIYKDYEGDTFFPEVDFDGWELENKEDHESTDKNSGENVKFSFLTFRRKRK